MKTTVIFVVQSPSRVQSLWPHGWQHARPPCPSPSRIVCLSSSPLHHWCHPAILSSDTLFSFCPESLPASRTFPMSWLFVSGGQSIGASASASVLPMSIQGWFPLGLTDLISLLSKRLSGVFSSTTVWRNQFFGALPSLWSSSHNHMWPLEDPSLDSVDFFWQNDVSGFQHTVSYHLPFIYWSLPTHYIWIH